MQVVSIARMLVVPLGCVFPGWNIMLDTSQTGAFDKYGQDEYCLYMHFS